MKRLIRSLVLLLSIFALTQSARAELACGAASGDATMSGMPSHDQMDGHSSPTRAPQHHPCGPMSGALCQTMTGCLDFGTPMVALRIEFPPSTHAAPQTALARVVLPRDLAPPLTPPRA
jgi:hypothetical protein